MEKEKEKNQCDGCKKGMPIRNGVHYYNLHPFMNCTKDHYMEKENNWEEEFEKAKGTAFSYPDWSGIKDFIRKTISHALKEERNRISNEVKEIEWSDDYKAEFLKGEVLSVINKE